MAAHGCVQCWLIRALGLRRIKPGRRLSLLRDRKPGGGGGGGVCVSDMLMAVTH